MVIQQYKEVEVNFHSRRREIVLLEKMKQKEPLKNGDTLRKEVLSIEYNVT